MSAVAGPIAPPLEAIVFDKYEGLGNDFVVVRAATEDSWRPADAVALCDRRRGVGADGVLLVLPPRSPGCDARMRVLNADGSVPEMCGNGVRCVALAVARSRGLREGVVRIDTDAGPRSCAVSDREGSGEARVTVDMGVVRVFADRTVDLEGAPVVLAIADAGNPHAVIFGEFSREDVEHAGARIAVHPDFPRGTNVEFARVRKAHGGAAIAIDLTVWERGVGVTLACGTGACATAAVACAKGLAPVGVPVAVWLPGGRLDIIVDAAAQTTMQGPARHVFSGRMTPVAHDRRA
jgi:diaminopimelate epimerase